MATTNPQMMYAQAAPQYDYYVQHQYAAQVHPGSQYAPPPPPLGYEHGVDVGAGKRSADEARGAMAGPNKRPRPNSAGGSGELFPQRPGEKMCAYYMTTRTCSFGVTCRFDHPAWVPAGGIPNWKEGDMGGQVTAVGTPVDPATLPQRPTEPDCAYFMKTGECRYGSKCRFNHPREKLEPSSTDEQAQQPSATATAVSNLPVRVTPATTFNSKGLPLRPGEGNCVFYGKTGSCKYGAACRYNHPESMMSGGRTGATLQPQQAVYIQPQQNLQYQVVQPVQAAQDYAYPTTAPAYSNTTTAYTNGTPVYSNAGPAYPSATPTYTTSAPAYPSPTPPYPTQQYMPATTDYMYPPGATVQQSYPGTPTQAYSTSQTYPPGTNAQNYSQGTSAHTYPPGTTSQSYPPGTQATMEYAYPTGQPQTEYAYPTQAAGQPGTEYVYAMEQPAQAAAEQYAYSTDSSVQQIATEYAYTTVTPVQAPQEYAYAAAQAYQSAGAVQAVYGTHVAQLSLPHPQRPGEPDCTFYIKTGECSFGATCKFHHPPDRVPTGIPKPSRNQIAMKLSLAGLPRRESESPCAYYMKTGACKFGLTCKYDHPPPQEVIAKAVEASRPDLPASYDLNLPADGVDATELPPGTDVPAVTAAAL